MTEFAIVLDGFALAYFIYGVAASIVMVLFVCFCKMFHRPPIQPSGRVIEKGESHSSWSDYSNVDYSYGVSNASIPEKY
ncbi:hypothetical protein HZS_7128 [Henneguya salminicola]|nr:hypothetical protein HZS_7128 [Henneguya salminicola]